MVPVGASPRHVDAAVHARMLHGRHGGIVSRANRSTFVARRDLKSGVDMLLCRLPEVSPLLICPL